MKSRKLVSVVLIIVLMLLASLQMGYAADNSYETYSLNARRLNYWYCDNPTEEGVYKIGRFDSSDVSLQVNKLNTNSFFYHV